MLKVKSVSTVQTNDYYNFSRRNNGGGYDQPEYTIQLENGWTLMVADLSCGDFGTRYSLRLVGRKGQTLKSAFWGSFVNVNQQESNLVIEDCDILMDAFEKIGVCPIFKY